MTSNVSEYQMALERPQEVQALMNTGHNLAGAAGFALADRMLH
jgi:hypothetical protein